MSGNGNCLLIAPSIAATKVPEYVFPKSTYSESDPNP